MSIFSHNIWPIEGRATLIKETTSEKIVASIDLLDWFLI